MIGCKVKYLCLRREFRSSRGSGNGVAVVAGVDSQSETKRDTEGGGRFWLYVSKCCCFHSRFGMSCSIVV